MVSGQSAPHEEGTLAAYTLKFRKRLHTVKPKPEIPDVNSDWPSEGRGKMSNPTGRSLASQDTDNSCSSLATVGYGW